MRNTIHIRFLCSLMLSRFLSSWLGSWLSGDRRGLWGCFDGSWGGGSLCSRVSRWCLRGRLCLNALARARFFFGSFGATFEGSSGFFEASVGFLLGLLGFGSHFVDFFGTLFCLIWLKHPDLSNINFSLLFGSQLVFLGFFLLSLLFCLLFRCLTFSLSFGITCLHIVLSIFFLSIILGFGIGRLLFLLVCFLLLFAFFLCVESCLQLLVLCLQFLLGRSLVLFALCLWVRSLASRSWICFLLFLLFLFLFLLWGFLLRLLRCWLLLLFLLILSLLWLVLIVATTAHVFEPVTDCCTELAEELLLLLGLWRSARLN